MRGGYLVARWVGGGMTWRSRLGSSREKEKNAGGLRN